MWMLRSRRGFCSGTARARVATLASSPIRAARAPGCRAVAPFVHVRRGGESSCRPCKSPARNAPAVVGLLLSLPLTRVQHGRSLRCTTAVAGRKRSCLATLGRSPQRGNLGCVVPLRCSTGALRDERPSAPSSALAVWTSLVAVRCGCGARTCGRARARRARTRQRCFLRLLRLPRSARGREDRTYHKHACCRTAFGRAVWRAGEAALRV